MPRKKKAEPLLPAGKKWSELSYDEKRAFFPAQLTKLSRWLLTPHDESDFVVTVNDWKAVMK